MSYSDMMELRGYRADLGDKFIFDIKGMGSVNISKCIENMVKVIKYAFRRIPNHPNFRWIGFSIQRSVSGDLSKKVYFLHKNLFTDMLFVMLMNKCKTLDLYVEKRGNLVLYCERPDGSSETILFRGIKKEAKPEEVDAYTLKWQFDWKYGLSNKFTFRLGDLIGDSLGFKFINRPKIF